MAAAERMIHATTSHPVDHRRWFSDINTDQLGRHGKDLFDRLGIYLMVDLHSLSSWSRDAKGPWTLFGSALVALLALKLVVGLIRSRIQWSKMPPGPKGLPFVGNFFQAMGPRPMRLQFGDWTQQFGIWTV